jgi:cell division protein ZapA (FtsZ GTPase activity inhibitor)
MSDDNVVDIEGYKIRASLPKAEDVPEEVTDLVPRESYTRSGRVVTPDEAFAVYAADGSRSLRRTAKLLDIPEGTVLSWSSRHGWRQRLQDTDIEVAEGVFEAGAVALMSQHLASIKRLIQIRDSPKSSPMAAIMATKELNRMQEKVAESMLSRMAISMLGDELEDEELDKLAAQGEEGVAILLQRARDRSGRG